ncbi:MAG: GNAT family N-acetyltransferase [Nocardioidaceae bacterium]|nr:GNAT family N-acetyltransferase [Nocardioidaceae bacterium]
MDITRVHPDDASAAAEFTRITTEAAAYDNPYPTSYSLEEQREELRNRDPENTVEGYLGTAGGVAVAAGSLEMPVHDNTEKAWLGVSVAPKDRRRGYGSEMASFLEVQAQRRGRTTLTTAVGYPTDADESHPDRRFATKHGYSFSQVDVHRVLDLPADQALLQRLREDAEPHHRDYTFRDSVGLPAEEILEDYCVLLNAILVDAPSGEIDYEEGSTTPKSLAERVESLRIQGRTLYTDIAFDAAEIPVAHSQLVVPAHDLLKIYQWDTIVHRDHRGHRLGLATKVRNLAIVQALHPERTSLHTWNAESNHHMVAVNDAMGFRPVRYFGEYYRKV